MPPLLQGESGVLQNHGGALDSFHSIDTGQRRQDWARRAAEQLFSASREISLTGVLGFIRSAMDGRTPGIREHPFLE